MVCVPNYHNNSNIPAVGLWNFNGNLLDAAGSNHMSVAIGTERYTDLFPGSGGGLRGILLDGSSVVGLSSAIGTFQITGNLTIELIVTLAEDAPGSSYVVSHAGTGETADTNYLYSIRVIAGNRLSYLAEQSNGTNIIYDSSACLCVGEPAHIALVRSSNQVSFYLNGLLVGAASSGLVAPTSGTSGKLKVGGDDANQTRSTVAVASLKIINSALSGSQVADEYADSLGSCFPRI